jgi:hypothetical protein
MLQFDVNESRFSETAGRLMYRQRRSSFLRSSALAATPACRGWSFLLWREYHWGLVLGMSLLFLFVGIFLWTRPNPR